MKKFLAGLFLCTLAVSSHAKDNDVLKTWNNGSVYAPGNFFPRSIKNFKPDQTYPIILYFHGCGGISNWNDIPWAKFFNDRGFLVVMPDSFARPGKTKECDLKSLKRPSIADGYLRVDEINYAIKKIKETGWSNGKIFLMGHSQGAWALTRFPIEDVDGIILSSLVSCQMAVNVSPNVPVLRIGYSADPWNTISPVNCDSHLVKNNFTMKIVDNREHETYYSEELKRSVSEFLEKILNK